MARTTVTRSGFIGVPYRNLKRKTDMANFATWTQENLAQFAQEANDTMIAQNERIEHLQRDLKDAIEAYRALMRISESQRGQ